MSGFSNDTAHQEFGSSVVGFGSGSSSPPIRVFFCVFFTGGGVFFIETFSHSFCDRNVMYRLDVGGQGAHLLLTDEYLMKER